MGEYKEQQTAMNRPFESVSEVQVKALVKEVMRIGLPMSASQLSQFSLLLIMLFFAGRLGVHELGGASIALGILNATGFAFGSGLCGALETVLSHSYGRDPNSPMFGVYAQRMFLILMFFTIPLCLLLANVEPLLAAIGEPPEVVQYVGRFCRICVFGMPPIMLLELLRRYYASQHRSNPVFVVVLAAALLNPVLQYVLVHIWGYNGIAVGWVLLLIAMDVALLGYLRITGIYRQTWNGWSRSAFNNWIPLMKLALPSLGMSFSEWTAMEVNSICAGFLSSEELAAYAISSQVANLCWSGVSGFFIASTVLVGNCVGEGDPKLGRRYALVSSIIVLVTSLVNYLIVFSYRYQIAYIFTSDSNVVDIFARVVPLFMLYHVLDSVQSNFLGILRGCGMQLIGVIIVLVALTFVGTPLGLYLMFRRHFGVEALWIGPVLGCAVTGIPAYLFVFFRRIKWSELRPQLEDTEENSDNYQDALTVVIIKEKRIQPEW